MPAKENKIVFLFEFPFSKRDTARFGLASLTKRGFDVEVIDFTKVFNPAFFEGIPSRDLEFSPLVKRPQTMAEAVRFVGDIPSDAVCINLLYLTSASYPVLKKLSDGKSLQVRLHINRIPTIMDGHGIGRLRHVWERLRHITPGKVRDGMYRLFFGPKLKMDTPDLIIAAGELAAANARGLPGVLRVIDAHSFDYDAYLSVRDEVAGDGKRTAVFLDEYFPFHPDHLNANEKPCVTVEDYYPRMNKLFDHLEKEYGFKVIIAAHPKSHYENHPDYYANREVVLGKTAELIRDCEMVIMHYSTAVNLAVLFKKPILFATTEEVDIDYGPHIRNIAGLFGVSPLVLDDAFEGSMSGKLAEPSALYDDYIRNYIKSPGSRNARFWDIVADEVLAFQP